MILFLEQVKIIIFKCFLKKECKYAVKEKNMSEYITHNIQISSDSDREDDDEENSNEEN